jgi:hypothetical protein
MFRDANGCERVGRTVEEHAEQPPEQFRQPSRVHDHTSLTRPSHFVVASGHSILLRPLWASFNAKAG